MIDGKALAEFWLKSRETALEEAAKACEAQFSGHPQRPLKFILVAQQCAAAIRALSVERLSGESGR